MRPLTKLATAATLTAAVFCRPAAAQWNGTMRDSAGIKIVANTARGVWGPRQAWTFQEDLRIGTIDDDAEYQFGQVGWIDVASDGRIYVLDTQGQHVKVFTPEGKYDRTIGGPGGGPGELAPGAMFVALSRGDTLFVPDLANRRVNRYAPDGSTLESFPLRLEDGLPAVWRSTANGLVAVQIRPLALPDRPARDSADVVLLLDTDGSVADTLMRFESGQTIKLGGPTPEINLYSPEASWNVTGDRRVLFGVNDDYRIEVRAPGGTVERIITLPFEPRPVGARDRDAVMKFMERAWTDAGVPANALPRLRSIVHFGELFPAFNSLMAGPRGSIWVQHVQAASDLSEDQLASYNLLEDAGAPQWDVFDNAGRFLGTVTTPARFAPRQFRGDLIYGVARDEYDVQYVVRLRIVGADSE